MKKLLLFLIFPFFAFTQCPHSFQMIDSFGDGWNGASVDIVVNGSVVVAGATNVATLLESASFDAATGDAISLANWVSGIWDGEISWEILDGAGTVIGSGVYGELPNSTGFCTPPPPCPHSLSMIDSFGDGWNGASVDIVVNGSVVVAGATNVATLLESASFDAATGDAISLANWVSGIWDSEISWEIIDGAGTVIGSGTYGGLTNATGYCPECPSPAITQWSMSTNSVYIDGDNDTSIVGYELEYSTSTFEPGDGTANSVTFESFPYTLTGLESGTTYNFAMRSNCGGGVFGSYIGNPYTTTFAIGCGESLSYSYISLPGVSTGTNYPVQWEPSQINPYFFAALVTPGGPNVESTVTITGQTELNYDYVYIVEMDSGNVLLTPTSGTFDSLEVTGVGELGIYIVADGSVDSTTNPEYTPVFSVSCSTAGLDDLSSNLFAYFPNPVNDQLTIMAQKNVDEITVYNMIGQVVLRQTPNSLETMVDMAEMQTGAYFIQVSIDNSIETVRILKN